MSPLAWWLEKILGNSERRLSANAAANDLAVAEEAPKKDAFGPDHHAKLHDRHLARLQVELFAQIEDLSGAPVKQSAEPEEMRIDPAMRSSVKPNNRPVFARLWRSCRLSRKAAGEVVALQTKGKVGQTLRPARLMSDTPRVHILVTEPDHAEDLVSCIASLSSTICDAPCRGVIVANSTVDPSLVGLEHAKMDSTLPALDAAIKGWGSEFVVVLTGELIAQDGWLDATFDAFARFADAGAVTGLIQDGAGHIATAGSSIDYCGRILPICAGDSAESFGLNPIKAVTAPSHGFVAFRRQDWAIIVARLADDGPFWTNLLSISLALADAGRRIYLQPRAAFARERSPAIEFSNVTDSWLEAIHRHRARQSFEYRMLSVTPFAISQDVRPRVLFVDGFVPTPKEDAGSVEVVWFVRMFLAWGCDVAFVPVYDYTGTDAKADLLRQLGVDVRFSDNIAGARAEMVGAAQMASLVILSRVTVARTCLGMLRREAPRAKVVFNTIDLHFLREERLAFLHSWAEALDAAFLLKRDEITTTARSDATIVISNAEKDILCNLVPSANIHHIPLPWLASPSKVPFAARSGLVFVGGFSHTPNVDAVKFLVEDIWPLARPRLPDATLRIVGSNVTDTILAFDSPEDRIDVLGYVEDLASVLDHARLSVAPLRFGAGVKGKVVSSLMHGLPCVMSPIANEGIDLRNGEEILECRTPAEFAEAIVSLHEDARLWHRLAEAGLRAVAAIHSVENVAMRMADLLESIGLAHLTKPLSTGAFDIVG